MSQTTIANLALADLGAASITDVDDGSKQGTLIGRLWDQLRRAELAAHPWSFAAARALLPNTTPAPPFGWSLAYNLPAGFLKLIQLGDDWCFYVQPYGTGPLFTIEGRQLLTDQGSPLPVRYVQDITNTGLFSAQFEVALAKRIAIACCEPLTQSLSKRQQLLGEYKDVVSAARRSNDIQLPPNPNVPQPWELAAMQMDG